MARVDLIVPTFNGTQYLIACLASLRSSTFTDFHLVVFDDGSDEPVEPAVRTLFPNATVLRRETNHGLTSAFNLAIDSCQSEYVVLLNNDTEVESDWLAELVACADHHPHAGSIASKLRLASHRMTLHAAGDTYSVRGMPGNRGVWLDDYGQYDVEDEVFSACAGAALYRRSALDVVRLENGDIFDTRLFMYCEDVDLGWRLQVAGYSCIFAPAAVVYHHLSATGGGSLASYYVARNVWLVLARSVPSSLRRRYWKRITCYHLGRFVRSLPNLRHPAGRRTIAGTFRGFIMFLIEREHLDTRSSSQIERIEGLLIDH